MIAGDLLRAKRCSFHGEFYDVEIDDIGVDVATSRLWPSPSAALGSPGTSPRWPTASKWFPWLT